MSKTYIEKRLSWLLSSLGLAHECNRRVFGYEVDAILIAQPVIVEADGELYHNCDRLRHDNLRDSFFHRKGYQVIRCWGKDLVYHPKKVREKLIVKLSRRGFEFKGLSNRERRILIDLRTKRENAFTVGGD